MRITWIAIVLLLVLSSTVLCASDLPPTQSRLLVLWNKLFAKPELPAFHAGIRALTHSDELPVEVLLEEAPQDAIGVQRWVVLAAGEDDARSIIVSSIFNRSFTLLLQAQERRSSSSSFATAVPDDDPEQEFLRLAEEQQINEIMESHDMRQELSKWTWGRVSTEKDTRLLWRWWIWKVPIIYFLSRASPYEPYVIRTLQLAWSPPPSPLELLELLARPHVWEHFHLWNDEFRPDGAQAWLPDWAGRASAWCAKLGKGVPGWALTTLSGLFAGTLLQYLHRPRKAALGKRSVIGKPSAQVPLQRAKKTS